MKKKQKLIMCEHIDDTNMRDCYEDAEWACICCGSKVCPNHKERVCPFGGEGYINL